MRVETPILRRSSVSIPGFGHFWFDESDADAEFTPDAYACDSGLSEYEVHSGDRIVLVISDKYVKESQKSENSTMRRTARMDGLLENSNLDLSVGYLYWWPEIVTEEK